MSPGHAQTEASSGFAPLAAGGDPNPAGAGGSSGLNPTTVTPVAAAATAATGAGKANATTTTAATAAGAGAGAGAKTPGQSNLEKLLNQLSGASGQQQQPPAEAVPGAGTLPEDPQWVTTMQDSVLAVAAKAQAQGGGGARRFMDYVAVAGCTPEDGMDLARMVESE